MQGTPFRKERCMQFTEAIKFHRKSGEPGFPATLHGIRQRMRLSRMWIEK